MPKAYKCRLCKYESDRKSVITKHEKAVHKDEFMNAPTPAAVPKAGAKVGVEATAEAEAEASKGIGSDRSDSSGSSDGHIRPPPPEEALGVPADNEGPLTKRVRKDPRRRISHKSVAWPMTQLGPA